MKEKNSFEVLVDMAGGDRAFLKRVSLAIVQETPKQLSLLRAAFISRDWEKLFGVAHKLQATAGVLSRPGTRMLLENIPRMRIVPEKLYEMEDAIERVTFDFYLTLSELSAFAGIDKG